MTKFLHREDASEYDKVFICSKHFSDVDVLLHFDIPKEDGTSQRIPRKSSFRQNPKPILHSNCP